MLSPSFLFGLEQLSDPYQRILGCVRCSVYLKFSYSVLSFQIHQIQLRGEGGCAELQDIAIPKKVLGEALIKSAIAKDREQLPPLLFSESTQNVSNKTRLTLLTGRGFKTSRLRVNYRSHSKLGHRTGQLF